MYAGCSAAAPLDIGDQILSTLKQSIQAAADKEWVKLGQTIQAAVMVESGQSPLMMSPQIKQQSAAESSSRQVS